METEHRINSESGRMLVRLSDGEHQVTISDYDINGQTVRFATIDNRNFVIVYDKNGKEIKREEFVDGKLIESEVLDAWDTTNLGC